MRSVSILSLLALLLACQAPPPGGAAPAAEKAEAAGVIDESVASADGVPIHYHVEGSGNPALVFVHCWSCDGGYWDGQVKEFSPAHRVVAIDLAGHGKSGLGRKEWTIQAFARDVQAVVETLDLRRVILIGHSMSGAVTLEAARLMPDRVIAIIPIDTLQNADDLNDPKQVAAFLGEMQKDFKGFTMGFVRRMFPAGADPGLVEKIAADMASAPPEVAIPAIRSAFSYDPKEALAAVKIPIHAINSDKYPTNLDANRRWAPQFEVEVMPGVGHFPMLEKPQEFNRRLAAAVDKIALQAAAAPGRAEHSGRSPARVRAPGDGEHVRVAGTAPAGAEGRQVPPAEGAR
jgi:pimeloyl-ACP methyl ester carboxylesterase